MRDVGGREPVRPDIDELYDAFKHPRADRPSLPLLDPAEARAYVREVRDKVLDVLDARAAGGAAGCSSTASCSAWSSSTSSSTTRRCWPPTSCARARRCSTRPPAAGRRARRSAAEVLVPAGPFTMGTSTEPWALDNERPAHEVDVRAVLDRHRAGDQRRLPARSSTTAATTTRAGGPARAGPHRAGRRARRAPLFWERRDGSWWRRRVRRASSRSRRDEPVMHVMLVRGRRLRALGRQAAAHRGRVGEGRPARPGHRAVAGATRGATTTRRRRTPTSASATCARPRSAPTRPAPRRSACTS